MFAYIVNMAVHWNLKPYRRWHHAEGLPYAFTPILPDHHGNFIISIFPGSLMLKFKFPEDSFVLYRKIQNSEPKMLSYTY